MKQLIPFALLLTFFGCHAPQTTTTTDDSLVTDTTVVDTTTVTSQPEQIVEKPNTWEYSADTNKMTSGVNYFARIEAKELLDFEFPYDGGSTASILLRHKEGENNVILQVSKGQFTCTSYDGCTVRVRFDQNKAESFSASTAADGSTEILFINSANKFIKKCKAAKTLLVEAEFYQAGNKQMEFNVTGLTWIH